MAVLAYSVLGGSLSLRAWEIALGVLVALGVGFWAGRVSRGPEISAEIEREIVLGQTYGEHVREVLNTFQRALSGDIAGVTLDDFISKGILDPARDVLTQGEGEEIRLSVLMPADDDQLKWMMVATSGHSLDGQKKFRLDISTSFAGRAYASKETKISQNVQDDDRFKTHSHARPGREYGSLIAVPLLDGDESVGVFCVISTFVEAFTAVDKTYVEILGAILGVAFSAADEDSGDQKNETEDNADGGSRPQHPAESGSITHEVEGQ
ncbi:MAG: GAF domain-containing protein [Solirubrobacterales bacterium]|nr:GAF domain-containing protein [Solirubrobacterales bacterium]